MRLRRFRFLRSNRTRILTAIAAAGIALGLGASPRAEPAAGSAAHRGHHDAMQHATMPMSPAEMEQWVNDWYKLHPPRGERAAAATAVDTFLVSSFDFDNDGNTGDVDTAFVFVGESVMWKMVDSGHTATNGTGFADPNAGQLFDQPLTGVTPEFTFTFNTVGTVPFFCRPHEGLMSGFVRVDVPSDVVPVSDRGRGAGFETDPTPNPTRDAASFRFVLRTTGRARIEVFDVRGRRVATPVDRVLGVGTYAASWDGRTQHGDRATAGVYYLRLSVPGAADTREVVVTR